jgi:hypothetical protein
LNSSSRNIVLEKEQKKITEKKNRKKSQIAFNSSSRNILVPILKKKVNIFTIQCPNIFTIQSHRRPIF